MAKAGLFDGLSSVEFEELTYDLLHALGFVNLNWRKGSGKSGHSADQGRDIEAERRVKDVDSSEYLEKHFIQCKHYKKGVPPEKLHDAIAWASAERPSVLLFVTSNFLSNSAKNWLKEYEQKNKPAFKIRIWERKTLERFLISQPMIVEKYNLILNVGLINLHPSHLEYISKPHYNSLEQFYKAIDLLDPSERDEIFSFAYNSVIKPRYREALHENERMGDLMLDKVDYYSFRAKCNQLTEHVAENFLVYSIVSYTLSWLAHFSNPTSNMEMIKRNQDVLSDLKNPLTEDYPEMTDERRLNMIKFIENHIKNAPDIFNKWNSLYKLVCEEILPHLLIDDVSFLEDSEDKIEW